MEFYVVADEDTVTGFRYAGVRGTVVRTPDEARAAFRRLVSEGRDLIIVTTEKIADGVRPAVNEIRFGEGPALIVEIPGPLGPSDETPSLEEMIRDAVGIKF
jgi:vacuolar-type H+-ATPase subunit F/Vma7